MNHDEDLPSRVSGRNSEGSEDHRHGRRQLGPDQVQLWRAAGSSRDRL